MGELSDIVEAYRDRQPFPPSYRRVADRLGISVTALTNWQRGLSRLPHRGTLLALSVMTSLPYERVLDAALRDTRYLPEAEARRAVAEAEAERISREEDLRDDADMLANINRQRQQEAAELGISPEVYSEEFGFDFEAAKKDVAQHWDQARSAARRVSERSAGHGVRQAMDSAGEESQDE